MLQFLCINFTIDVYHLCLILSSHTLVKDITIIQEAKCFEYVYFAQSKNILWNIQYKVQGPQSMELISENLKTLSLFQTASRNPPEKAILSKIYQILVFSLAVDLFPKVL